MAPHHVAVDGRGSREPIAVDNTDAGRTRNRRVGIFVDEANDVGTARPVPIYRLWQQGMCVRSNRLP